MTHDPTNRNCNRNNTACLVYHSDGVCPQAGQIGTCTCPTEKHTCERFAPFASTIPCKPCEDKMDTAFAKEPTAISIAVASQRKKDLEAIREGYKQKRKEAIHKWSQDEGDFKAYIDGIEDALSLVEDMLRYDVFYPYNEMNYD